MDLKQLKRRIVATGGVQLSKAELLLLYEEVDGMTAVLCGDVRDAIDDRPRVVRGTGSLTREQINN